MSATVPQATTSDHGAFVPIVYPTTSAGGRGHIMAMNPDELEVEFDEEKRNTCASMGLGCAVFCLLAIVAGMVALVVLWIQADNPDEYRYSVRSSDRLPVGVFIVLLVFGVASLLLSCCAVVSCRRKCVKTATEKCTITSTHLISSHQGAKEVVKKIPLQRICDVVVQDHGLLQSLIVYTEKFHAVGASATSRARRERESELVLRDLQNADEVREFIFAKKHELLLFPNPPAHHQMAIPIAQAIHQEEEEEEEEEATAEVDSAHQQEQQDQRQRAQIVDPTPSAPEFEVEQLRERLAEMEAQLLQLHTRIRENARLDDVYHAV